MLRRPRRRVLIAAHRGRDVVVPEKVYRASVHVHHSGQERENRCRVAAIRPNHRLNVLEFELVGLKTSPASKNTTALSFLVRFYTSGQKNGRV